jgi:hypothetical protein
LKWIFLSSPAVEQVTPMWPVAAALVDIEHLLELLAAALLLNPN